MIADAMMEQMQPEIHYAYSPLTEAVIDIRAQLPSHSNLATLRSLHTLVEADYPTRQDHVQFQGEIQFGEEVTSIATRTPDGYMFVSADGRQLFQARLDGFTFNRLKPYTRWNEFRSEARRLWTLYREIASPDRVIRIGVRYINRLELPLPFEKFDDFLTVIPQIPDDFPNPGLSNYFMQLTMVQPDLLSTLLLNEGFALPTNFFESEQESLPVILDIDLFREVDIPDNDDAIWDIFDRFRIRKNEVFEASITKQMREVIRHAESMPRRTNSGKPATPETESSGGPTRTAGVGEADHLDEGEEYEGALE